MEVGAKDLPSLTVITWMPIPRNSQCIASESECTAPCIISIFASLYIHVLHRVVLTYLGSGIRDLPGRTPRSDTADVHDHAPVLGQLASDIGVVGGTDEQRGKRLGDAHGAEDVDVEHGFKCLHVGLEDGRAGDDSGLDVSYLGRAETSGCKRDVHC